MSDLICRKTMMRCQTPGMCAPHGGCSTGILKETNVRYSNTSQPAEAEGVTRYDLDTTCCDSFGQDCGAEMEPYALGEWVKHDDHLAALSAVTAERDRLRALSVDRILLDVVPGDGEGHEVYAKSVEEVVAALAAEAERAEALEIENERLRELVSVSDRLSEQHAKNNASAMDLIDQLRAEVEARDARIASLFQAIAHGDQPHRAWLEAAITAHFSGGRMPDTVPSDAERLKAEVEALRGAMRKVMRQVDCNIRELARDLVNRLSGLSNGANPNDLYDYCDAIERAIDAAMAAKDGE